VVDYVREQKPDLVIMDLVIPGKDGLQCCSEIREFSNIPVIMLTGKSEEVDRLIGLEAGADDYMCKPFSAPELVMRVQAILRRTSDHVYYSIFSLDDDKHKISYKGSTDYCLKTRNAFIQDNKSLTWFTAIPVTSLTVLLIATSRIFARNSKILVLKKTLSNQSTVLDTDSGCPHRTDDLPRATQVVALLF